METRMQKWASKRAEIEREAKEIAEALSNEYKEIFNEQMGDPISQLEEIFNAFN